MLFSLASCGNVNLTDVIKNVLPDEAENIIDGILKGNPINGDSFTPIPSPSVVLPDAPKTGHTPLKKDEYYQFSLLSDTEKELYNLICTNIENQQNYINVKKYGLNEDNIDYILNKVLADNPQYFWFAKFLQYTIATVDGKDVISYLVLFYTDGEVTDNFDANGKFTATADREKIKQQKIAFDNLATNFLKSIPKDTPEIEKERLIHDFVLNSIIYADNEANLPLKRENYYRIYDVYGALVENYAVCEGYTRLFQYLCYQVGINSTFVYGESENESHSWNTVKIENEWYHVDTTWNDGSKNGIPLYNYFNLTEKQILTDHTLDTSVVLVPIANSETYSFANTFGIKINSSQKPANYQFAIDYLNKSNGKYLILVCSGKMPNADYLRKYVLNLNCDIQKYIKASGYNIKLKNTYFEVENFIYIERN